MSDESKIQHADKISHNWTKFYDMPNNILYWESTKSKPIMPANYPDKYYIIRLRRGDYVNCRVVFCEYLNCLVWEDVAGNRYHPEFVVCWYLIRVNTKIHELNFEFGRIIKISVEEFFEFLYMARRYASRTKKGREQFEELYNILRENNPWMKYERHDKCMAEENFLPPLEKINKKIVEELSKIDFINCSIEMFIKILKLARRYSHGIKSHAPSTFNNNYIKVIKKNPLIRGKEVKDDYIGHTWPFVISDTYLNKRVEIGRFEIEAKKFNPQEFFRYQKCFENM